jgi:hypothetical protein
VQEVSFYIAELYAAAGGGVKTAEAAGKLPASVERDCTPPCSVNLSCPAMAPECREDTCYQKKNKNRRAKAAEYEVDARRTRALPSDSVTAARRGHGSGNEQLHRAFLQRGVTA